MGVTCASPRPLLWMGQGNVDTGGYRLGLSAALTVVMKDVQPAGVTSMAGPLGCLESRMAMALRVVLVRSATSTQLLPVPSLWEDLRQPAAPTRPGAM